MSNRVTMGQDDSMMLQRDTLPMQVLNKLMDWIMDGKLKMGEKLNTEELARQLGVSRMPIREALKSLEKMGLAESIPYVGVKLVSLEQEDVLQIYLMRQLLEQLEKRVERLRKNRYTNWKRYIRNIFQLLKQMRLMQKSYTCKIENFILQSIPSAKWTEYVR